MSAELEVTSVTFTAAPEHLEKGGLLGWVAFTLAGKFRIEGVAVRRTADGRYALAFPVRQDGPRRREYYVRPINDPARREVEHAILRALGIEEVRT